MIPMLSATQRQHLDAQVHVFIEQLKISIFLSSAYQGLLENIKTIGMTDLQQFQSANARFMAQSFTQTQQRHSNTDRLIQSFSRALHRLTQTTTSTHGHGVLSIQDLHIEWRELQRHSMGLTQLQHQVERERLSFTNDLTRLNIFLERLVQLEYLVIKLIRQVDQMSWTSTQHALFESEKNRLLDILRQKRRNFEVYKVSAIQHAETIKLVLSNHDQLLENLIHMQTVQVTIAQSAVWSNGLSASLSTSHLALSPSAYNDSLIKLCHQQQALLSQIQERLYTERQDTKKFIH